MIWRLDCNLAEMVPTEVGAREVAQACWPTPRSWRARSRVARCSLSAELSSGGFRTRGLSLRCHAGAAEAKFQNWRSGNGTLTTDQKISVDAAVLREALMDQGSRTL